MKHATTRSNRAGMYVLSLALLVLACPLLFAFPDRSEPRVRVVEPETADDAVVVQGRIHVRAKAHDRDGIKYIYMTRKRPGRPRREFWRWRGDESDALWDTAQFGNDVYFLRTVASDRDLINRTGAEYGTATQHEIRVFVNNGPTVPEVHFVPPTPPEGQVISGLVPIRVVTSDREGVEHLIMRAIRPDGFVEWEQGSWSAAKLFFWNTRGEDGCSPNGTYEIIARATDLDRMNRTWLYSGTLGEARMLVTVNNGPTQPRLHFTDPTPMSGLPVHGRITLQAWADDPEGIARVIFGVYNARGEMVWWSTVEDGAATHTPSFSVHWDTRLGDRAVPDGEYMVIATAVDKDTLNPSEGYTGTAATTEPLTIRVDNTKK